jgi:hypothetical protein
VLILGPRSDTQALASPPVRGGILAAGNCDTHFAQDKITQPTSRRPVNALQDKTKQMCVKIAHSYKHCWSMRASPSSARLFDFGPTLLTVLCARISHPTGQGPDCGSPRFWAYLCATYRAVQYGARGHLADSAVVVPRRWSTPTQQSSMDREERHMDLIALVLLFATAGGTRKGLWAWRDRNDGRRVESCSCELAEMWDGAARDRERTSLPVTGRS